MGTDDRSASANYASAPFPYLRWAKDWLAPDDLSLGLSGIPALGAEEREGLGLPPPEIGDPWAALKAALAARYDVEPAAVLPAAGTSEANFLAFFALAHGRHVALESPAYEALPRLAAAVAGSHAPFRRDPARGWGIDPASLTDAVLPDTALIVVTDLHNPSGVRLEGDDLDLLIEQAERVDALVLVDEVYADFDPQERPSAVHRSPRVLVTSSLTKAHGLPDLRAGWILGAPEVIERLDRWSDLVHPVLPAAPLAQAAAYIPHGRTCLTSTRARAAERTAVVDAWVEGTEGVAWVRPHGGITGLLQLRGRDGGPLDGDAIAARLWRDHGVRAVPGSFFQVPSALRISYLLEPAHLERALAALGVVLASAR